MTAKKATMRIEWQGGELNDALKAAIAEGVSAWGLIHEQAAKAQLAPGRGYLTGRGQRSIHAAAPDYNYEGDFRPGGRSFPELGGRLVAPEVSDDRIAIAVGTGIYYMQIQEGRFMFMARSHDQSVNELEGEITSKTGNV